MLLNPSKVWSSWRGAVLLAVVAAARPEATLAQSASAPTRVEGVTVVAPRDPVIATTYPASGATVAPGLLVLKVGFDITMAEGGWSYAKSDGAAYPHCLDKPRLLVDGKTFVLLCSVAPSTAYAVELNAGAGPGFTGAGGRRGPHFTLRFSTSGAASVASLPLAMTAAALEDGDSPLMDSGAPYAAPLATSP